MAGMKKYAARPSAAGYFFVFRVFKKRKQLLKSGM